MGDAFLRNYVSIWDEDNKQIGLVPHSSSAATISAGTLSDNVIIVEDTSSSDEFISTFQIDYLQIA